MIEPVWSSATYDALVGAGIGVVGHVPDGGLRHLIERCATGGRMRAVGLTSEEEGIALAAGAWLGGSRGAVLMQSSGVGNCVNMLSLLGACAIPAFVLVTMRGGPEETNPWQVPMGRAVGDVLVSMGVEVRRVTEPDAVGPTVARVACTAFDSRVAAAVLVDQAVIGAKQFDGNR